ncbi:hypothetical protein [uncultured Jatrophihabitans sp.]|uniref:hypothetical protein n=1 Tax=uncultured Jatrophihabitans sp. TaxID=1610747 RepID=UPI0035CC51EF
MLVFSNAAPGQDREYNAWYDEVHVPEVLRLPGVMSARRFRLSAEQLDPALGPATGYVATYELDLEDLGSLREALLSAVQRGQMTMSPTVADMKSFIYEEITPVRTRE